MSVGRLVSFDEHGFTRKLESWCLYAAFTVPAEGKALVKVGISQLPFARIYQVHQGSGYPVQAALWVHAGTKRQGLTIERVIRARLAEYRTRGEWYEFDMTSPEHKEQFHSVCKVAYMRATGRKLEWRKTDMDQVREICGVDFNKSLTRRNRLC